MKSVAEMQSALKWKIILATNPIPTKKKRRQTGVTTTSTKPSKRQWARQRLKCRVIAKPPTIFIDCLFVLIKRDYETKEYDVCKILGIRVDGCKEILELWIQDSKSMHAWKRAHGQFPPKWSCNSTSFI